MSAAPYLDGCPSLPDRLAAAASGTPTPEEQADLDRLIPRIAADIRRRREAWLEQHGLTDLDLDL